MLAILRRGPAKADSDEQAFEAKLAAEPAEAPVRRLSLYDTLLADVEAGKGMRRSKEDGEQPYKEVKEPVKPKPKPARAMKREAEAAVQAELRAKWPDSFNYTDYNPRLVLAASDALIQEELRRMNGPFGFDLEWSPFIRPGVQGTTALIQICDRQSVLLVHLAQMNYQLPDVLRRFIEDEEVIKLGVHINGDVHKLRRDFDVSPRGCVEISDLHRRYGGVGTAGGRLISLQRLVGHYLESYLPKDEDVRMGRWSHALSPAQIHYAANDVYASLMVVERAAEAAGRTAGQLAQDLAALAS
ncbi:hypothetical protein JCM10049v2_004074 [Rhodotorula toruloides]